MNWDLPTDPRQALEASLTALLLDELPADQAEFLRRTMAQDAELARIYERLRRTVDLVRETETSPANAPAPAPEPLKLSDERREELLQHFKTATPTEFAAPAEPRRRVPWLVPVGIAACLVLVLGAMLLPALSKAKARSQLASSMNYPKEHDP